MKILITGGSGLLGKSLLETAPKEHVLSLTYGKNWQANSTQAIWYGLNIKNRSDVCDLFEIFKPNIVQHW
jgi:dTDP-4-dehydrorhamnose reductase